LVCEAECDHPICADCEVSVRARTKSVRLPNFDRDFAVHPRIAEQMTIFENLFQSLAAAFRDIGDHADKRVRHLVHRALFETEPKPERYVAEKDGGARK